MTQKITEKSQMNKNNKPVNIYTDGACSGNQNDTNTGGWGAVLEYGNHHREICGGEPNTTNNRMEMKALIEALIVLKKNGLKINVFSDSSYLMNCFREKWYVKWEQNGWKNSKKEPVENRDLWEQLLLLLPENEYRFFRVKGHVNTVSQKIDLKKLYAKFLDWNGNEFTYDDFIHATEMNNRADKLANEGISGVRAESGENDTAEFLSGSNEFEGGEF